MLSFSRSSDLSRSPSRSFRALISSSSRRFCIASTSCSKDSAFCRLKAISSFLAVIFADSSSFLTLSSEIARSSAAVRSALPSAAARIFLTVTAIASASFLAETDCRRSSVTLLLSSSRWAIISSRPAVIFSISALTVSFSALSFCAAAAFSDTVLSRTVSLPDNAESSFLSSADVFSLSFCCSPTRLISPKTRILSSCVLVSSAFAAVIWASSLASSDLAESSATVSSLYLFSSCDSSSVRRLISPSRPNMPAFLTSEPPVSEPPAFTTCPSSVTTLNLYLFFFAIATAESRSSVTAILPSRDFTISLYFSSHSTKSQAGAM